MALAPCALDAYPEAYEEFKHVLLALIFDKEDQTSPVAEEWSERRRVDLAGLLSSILRAHLNAYDPIFSMTLRYLISIHKVYCLRQGVTSPVSDLIERLLLEERDPPAPPQQILYEAPPFDEVDIQALAHAVELTRQSAVDSLKFANGDLFRAFQNELCRMKLDVSMLDELVHEYCVYRGITDGVITSSSGAQGSTVDVVSMQGVDTEMRSASDTTSNEDCSTSDTNHPRNSSRRLRRTRHHATGQGRRKRWRGRVDMLEPTTDASLNETKDIFINETNRQDLMCHDFDTSGGALEEGKDTKLNGPVENVSTVEDHEYEIVLDMKELTKNGMAAEVVEEVNAMDPDFFTRNPLLLFQLKQVEFLKLVHDGDVTMALKVASTHLGPLAASQHSLMKPLKETLLALLKPSDDAFTKAIPLSVLATSLQVALGKRLGIEEPQLMRIMRATLHTHSEWFKLQMCKDRFEEFLKIDNLKDVEAPAFNDTSSRTYTDNSHGSSQITTSSNKLPDDDNSPTQISSNEIGCDENAIIKVMEFLALPRSDAIQLLMQYDGNAEAVIQQIFS